MATEFLHDDHILVLDGRVLEIFHRGVTESRRYHVAFMGVSVKPKGDRYQVRVGPVVGDDLFGGVGLSMDGPAFQRFQEFIGLARAARDTAPNP